MHLVTCLLGSSNLRHNEASHSAMPPNPNKLNLFLTLAVAVAAVTLLWLASLAESRWAAVGMILPQPQLKVA
jgi:hypothetical protein